MDFLERVRFHFIREKNLLHAFHLNECAVCVRHCLSFESVFVFWKLVSFPRASKIVSITRSAAPPTDRRVLHAGRANTPLPSQPKPLRAARCPPSKTRRPSLRTTWNL